MNQAEFKALIDRYLSGQASEEEKHLVDEWYSSFAAKPAKKEQPDTSAVRDEIYGRLNQKWHQQKPAAPVISIRRILPYAAAITGILVLFFFARNRVRRSNNATAEKFTVLSCAAGEVKKINLPDGSSVWLNSRSRMRISDDFQVKDSRNVFLDQGEAFFEVTKNPRRPFFVITPSVTTRVLGTSFNVKAYKELTNAVVTVATGRVQVKGGSRILAVLTRGQQVSYNTLTQKFELATVDPENAHQWMNGEYKLNQAGFNELAFAINNLYGYKLVSTDPASNHYKYSLRLKSARTLEETIKIICSVHQNHYRRNKNEVVITK